MLYYDQKVFNKIKGWNYNNIYVVSDFDKTLTSSDSNGSWGIIDKMNLLPEEYTLERHRLFEHYRPIELDTTMDEEEKCKEMSEWWRKHISLLVKYQLSEEKINEVASDINFMKFRSGVKTFLERMYRNNVPVIIISAGIGNFIEIVLKNNDCNYPNIYIISNYLKFSSGEVIGMEETIIHSLNKDEASLPDTQRQSLADRPNVILFGDMIEDIKMVSDSKRDKALKVCFLGSSQADNIDSYKENYDIVCTDGCSFENLEEILDNIK